MPVRTALAVLAAACFFLVNAGAGCLQTEIRRDEGTANRLSALGQGPGVQATVNQMPTPVRPDAERFKPIPLTTGPAPAGNHTGAPPDAAATAAAEARALLHPPVAFGRLTCRAFDPVTRRPLQVLIRAVAAHHRYEFFTDAVHGQASVDLPVGRVQLYSAAGEFFTPYSNQIDVQPGDNQVDVLLTAVPELTPARVGLATLAFARSARQDWATARRRCAGGQADWVLLLGDPSPDPDGLTAVDGPYGRSGSRFAGIGRGAAPRLATGPCFAPSARPLAADSDGKPLQGSVAPAWDDLYRLQQADFLRLWLYPAGRPTDPQLARLLDLPARQYRGPEAWLAAERGPGLELVTLGSHGEGEAEYFELLNRGVPVVAVAEPEEADPPPGAAAAHGAAGPHAGLLADTPDDIGSYQSLPEDLYAAAITPRTLIRVGQFTPLAARPSAAATLQWLRAGQAQVCYGPVLDWKVREFAEVVGYPAQPVPAADRVYHIDLTAFVGPGAPPACRSIQLIELLRNGVVVARLPIDRPLQSVRDLTFEVRESARCWYLLRAYSGPTEDNSADTRAPRPGWRVSWSAPIHFAIAGAASEAAGAGFERRSLPVAVRAFRAINPAAVDAVAIVTRGGYLVQKTALPGGVGEVSARVGDHILVGGPGWEWRETVVSPYENRTGDPWRALDREPAAPEPAGGQALESAAAANARLSGMGILCPLTPRQGAAPSGPSEPSAALTPEAPRAAK